MNLKVHILWGGFAICGFSPLIPKHWPQGHKWVPPHDARKATCKACVQIHSNPRKAP